MQNLKLTTSESALLLDLISQCLSWMNINPDTGKHELPGFKYINLKKIDSKVLRSLHSKLD